MSTIFDRNIEPSGFADTSALSVSRVTQDGLVWVTSSTRGHFHMIGITEDQAMDLGKALIDASVAK